jgi:glutathione S-transferase
VPNNNQAQLKLWGRANSVNVQKVLWCLRELDLAYERIDAGMQFGRNRDPDYLAMNPNGCRSFAISPLPCRRADARQPIS